MGRLNQRIASAANKSVPPISMDAIGTGALYSASVLTATGISAGGRAGGGVPKFI